MACHTEGFKTDLRPHAFEKKNPRPPPSPMNIPGSALKIYHHSSVLNLLLNRIKQKSCKFYKNI